jgi:alkyl hydroperoxide reductase subunit AhpC/predicted Ser/Thr protein kinase
MPRTRPADDVSDVDVGDRVTLDDFRDRWLVLFFYPRDFSLVCPTELTALSRRIAEFDQRDCDILGVSTDSRETHERWIRTPSAEGGLGGLNFPLASDESGEVCRAYGVHLPKQNVALRGLFVIDPNGVIQYEVVHNMSVGRSVDELLRVLDALQSGGMCPEAWSQDRAPIDPLVELGPNRVVGGYRIDSEIGRGGCGVVFRAWDTVLARTVALKVLRTDAAHPAEELLREARSAAALNHPHICTIHTVDSSTGVPVIVMELVEGRPLNALLAEGLLPRETANRLASQIASGLAAAHAAGVVHGDLKPANILVRDDGVAKLMDFGLSRRIARTDDIAAADALADTIIHDEFELRNRITGTPCYMSPEQTRGQPISPASDIFSFGLILFELLTSRRAISATSLLEALHAVNHLDIRLLTKDMDLRDVAILSRLLAAEPSERPSAVMLSSLLS